MTTQYRYMTRIGGYPACTWITHGTLAVWCGTAVLHNFGTVDDCPDVLTDERNQ